MNLANIDTNRTVRYFAYFLEIFLCCILQGIDGFLPKIFGCVPLLTASAVITIAVIEPEIPAMLFGLEAGFLLDVCGSTSLGTACILFTVVTCFVSAVAQRRLRISMKSAIIASALGLGAIFAGIWFICYIAKGYSLPYIALADKYLPMYIYTVLTVPFMFLINIGLFKGLQNRN